ncbi:D-alanine--D-alanine ligase family protein [Alteromonas gracilis]
MTENDSSQVSGSARPRVAVVFGGRSEEHGVSCITAGSVLAAIDRETYDVVPVGIARDGRWVLERDEAERLRLDGAGALPQVDPEGPAVALLQREQSTELTVTAPGEVPQVLGDVDVVMPLLHGPFGEDGTIQGLLEMAGVRYVGSGVLASAVGMDKHHMKVAFAGAGLPTLPYAFISPRQWRSDRPACEEAVAALGMPVFVKPCRAGSSFGISKVTRVEDLAAAVEEAQRHDPRVIVEAFAGPDAREIECGVLEGEGDSAPEASVVAELIVGGDHEFYDFEAKYLPDQGTSVALPADVPQEVAEQMQDLAVRAFEALGCEGLARVDFFLLHDGRVVINEINTMPGFTPTSMFPQVWAESGVDYPALVDRLLRLALARDVGLR